MTAHKPFSFLAFTQHCRHWQRQAGSSAAIVSKHCTVVFGSYLWYNSDRGTAVNSQIKSQEAKWPILLEHTWWVTVVPSTVSASCSWGKLSKMPLNSPSQMWPRPTTYHKLNPAETPAIQKMALQSQLSANSCDPAPAFLHGTSKCLSQACFVFTSCPRKWHLYLHNRDAKTTTTALWHRSCNIQFISNKAKLQATRLQSSSSFSSFLGTVHTEELNHRRTPDKNTTERKKQGIH